MMLSGIRYRTVNLVDAPAAMTLETNKAIFSWK